jgi:hypothetical protein
MKRTSCLAVFVAAACSGSLALAQPPKQPAAKPGAEQKMPPSSGMSEADMQACMAAATPGPMHEHLAKSVGTWTGTCKMWMSPGTEPTTSDCTTVISPMMGGRFIKIETSGEMPGMGPFEGFGLNGYDNVSKKFVSTWADSMGTGMMNGTGELSADGKTLNWACTFNCPLTKGAMACRQVEHHTGNDKMTFEMYGPDPKTGTEYKMMQIDYTRAVTAGELRKLSDPLKPSK